MSCLTKIVFLFQSSSYMTRNKRDKGGFLTDSSYCIDSDCYICLLLELSHMLYFIHCPLFIPHA